MSDTQPETVAPPRVLTIAGSDSGGGAGIQADLKTFAAHGVYGLSVVTAVTAQNTCAVTAVEEIPATVVVAQLEAVLDDIGADAVKIGMLSNAEIVRGVADLLRQFRPPNVVLDPVMVAKSGDPLLRDDAVEALREELLPLATVLTPNLPEAERLAGLPVGDEHERREVLDRLLEWVPAVLLKGGHGEGDVVEDVLQTATGAAFRYEHPRQDTTSTHGTGCTLSSAIAARLALGEPLEAAAAGAIAYLQRAIAAAYPIGGGHGPVNHDVAIDPPASDGVGALPENEEA